MITLRMLYDFLFRCFNCEKDSLTDLVIQETIKGFIEKCFSERVNPTLKVFIDYLKVARKYSQYPDFDFANFQLVSEENLKKEFNSDSVITLDEAYDLIDDLQLKKLYDLTKGPFGKLKDDIL